MSMIVYADSHTAAATQFVSRINEVILFPLITLLTVIALVVFLYGCMEYVLGSNNQTARETGRKHILWGIIGMLVMLSAYAILSIAGATFGVDVPDPVTRSPFAPTESPLPAARPESRAPGVSPTPTPAPMSVVSPSPTPRPVASDPMPGRVACSGDCTGLIAEGEVVYVASAGDTVASLGAGIVSEADPSRVIIQHDDGSMSVYTRVAPADRIVVGGRVDKGVPIGTVTARLFDTLDVAGDMPLTDDQAPYTIIVLDADDIPIDPEEFFAR